MHPRGTYVAPPPVKGGGGWVGTAGSRGGPIRENAPNQVSKNMTPPNQFVDRTPPTPSKRSGGVCPRPQQTAPPSSHAPPFCCIHRPRASPASAPTRSPSRLVREGVQTPRVVRGVSPLTPPPLIFSVDDEGKGGEGRGVRNPPRSPSHTSPTPEVRTTTKDPSAERTFSNNAGKPPHF